MQEEEEEEEEEEEDEDEEEGLTYNSCDSTIFAQGEEGERRVRGGMIGRAVGR